MHHELEFEFGGMTLEEELVVKARTVHSGHSISDGPYG